MTGSPIAISTIKCRKATIKTKGSSSIIKIIKETSMEVVVTTTTKVKVETITKKTLRATKDRMTSTATLAGIKFKTPIDHMLRKA
jgi:hypothetical protein